jgi:nitroreductase
VNSSAPLRHLVELATRAPSVHNTQPWYWCIDGQRLSLFADFSRQLQYADPDGRDLLISCGAALHHLRVAAAASGWRAQVRRMPNPANDAQLATVSFSPAQATSQDRAGLDQLTNRRTDRRRATSWPVSREHLDPLLAQGPPAGVTIMAVVSHQAHQELLQILAEAELSQREDPRYVDEMIRWTGREDGAGIPDSSLLRRGPTSGAEQTPSRFPSGTLPDHPPDHDTVESPLLVICTSSDDTASRLRAGEALGAVLLHATADGLLTVPLSQAVEVDRTRHLLQDELLDDAACPQVLVRVGWPPRTGEPVPPTPRRPVDEVLADVGSLPARLGPYRG